MKAIGHFISLSWVSKLKETKLKGKNKSFNIWTPVYNEASVLPPAKELDFKLPTKELPVKRAGKYPYSQLCPLCTLGLVTLKGRRW